MVYPHQSSWKGHPRRRRGAVPAGRPGIEQMVRRPQPPERQTSEAWSLARAVMAYRRPEDDRPEKWRPLVQRPLRRHRMELHRVGRAGLTPGGEYPRSFQCHPEIESSCNHGPRTSLYIKGRSTRDPRADGQDSSAPNPIDREFFVRQDRVHSDPRPFHSHSIRRRLQVTIEPVANRADAGSTPTGPPVIHWPAQ
jgi:hypothetical protein